MKGDMLTVDRQIEQEHGGGMASHAGSGMRLNRPHPLLCARKAMPTRGKRKQQAHDDRVQHHEAQIVRPAPKATDRLWPARRQRFPQRHQREDAEEASQTDDAVRPRSQWWASAPPGRLDQAWHMHSIYQLNDR